MPTSQAQYLYESPRPRRTLSQILDDISKKYKPAPASGLPNASVRAGRTLLDIDRACLRSVGAHEKHWSASFADPAQAKASPVFQWLGNQPADASVLLVGSPGLGKTWAGLAHLARAMRPYVCFDGDTAYTRGGMLRRAHEVARKLGHRDEQGSSWLANMNRANVVMLDDLGAEVGFGWSAEAFRSWLFDWLDIRTNNPGVTIITTNLSPDKLTETYGEPVYSRLKTLRVACGQGVDLRGRHE